MSRVIHLVCRHCGELLAATATWAGLTDWVHDSDDTYCDRPCPDTGRCDRDQPGTDPVLMACKGQLPLWEVGS